MAMRALAVLLLFLPVHTATNPRCEGGVHARELSRCRAPGSRQRGVYQSWRMMCVRACVGARIHLWVLTSAVTVWRSKRVRPHEGQDTYSVLTLRILQTDNRCA